MTTGPQRLDPRVRALWLVVGCTVAVTVALAVVVGAIVVGSAPLVGGALVLAAVLVGVAVLVPSVRYRSWRWELTDEGIELAHGVLVRQQSAIPTFRVQQIDIRQGPVERAFGLATLRITTASSGSDGAVPGLAAERAEDVRQALLRQVAADDGV